MNGDRSCLLSSDLLQDRSQHRGGGSLGMGKKLHFDAYLPEILDVLVIQCRTLPVVAVEHHVEMQLLPGAHLVHVGLGDDPVHITDGLHDGDPLLIGNDGLFLLIGLHHLIGADAYDQIITHLLCIFQQIQVADVEQIKHACGISDLIFFHSPLLLSDRPSRNSPYRRRRFHVP